MHKQTVFVVGAGGMVGATAAYALAIEQVVDDIVLIDVAADLVGGHAMDINHATAFTGGINVRVGDYSQIQENDIVVITAGIAQKPGQTRMELLSINAGIIKEIVGAVMRQGKPVYLLLVANPVDVLTYVALKESGLPKERVFGTGTTLDTARLRVTLANLLKVSQQDVHAYILGEHGDSSFAALSNATVSGVPLASFPGYQPGMTATIEQDIRDAAYRIIEAKKSTYYGIGAVIAEIVKVMIRNTPSIFPVCSLAEGEYGLSDVVVGLPSLVSARGVKIIDEYPLSDGERGKLRHSAQLIREAIENVR